MAKNNFFSDLNLPSDEEILADARLTFPSNPLYKDINKKYREGFIRGQILLRDRMIQMYNASKREFAPIKVKPPQQILCLMEQAKTQKDLYLEHIDNIIFDDKTLLRDKINILEAEMELITDEEIHEYVRIKIDLMEDRLMMRRTINHINKKKEAFYAET